MQSEKAPEFDPRRPVPSALAVVGAVVFSPRGFYLNLPAEGPLRAPILFVLLVGSVAGFLAGLVALASNVLFETLTAAEVGTTALEALLFALLSPVGVGIAAAIYLLSIKTFVGPVGTFRQVYRIVAYAFAAFIFAWVPVLGALAMTYALLALVGIGVRSIYRTSFITALVTALVGFVPVMTALIWLTTL